MMGSQVWGEAFVGATTSQRLITLGSELCPHPGPMLLCALLLKCCPEHTRQQPAQGHCPSTYRAVKGAGFHFLTGILVGKVADPSLFARLGWHMV